MSFIQVGDLAQHLMMRRQNTLLKTQMNTLTQELASGRKSDIASAVSADFSVLGDIEHTLEIEGAVQELYDVTVLKGVRRPMILGFQTQEIRFMISPEPILCGVRDGWLIFGSSPEGRSGVGYGH